MNWKSFGLGVLATVAVGLIVVFVLSKTPRDRLTVRAYFTDAAGLRTGARVRLAGFDVGKVKSIRLSQESKTTPVEIVMTLNPPAAVKIPKDSTALLSTAGVLGETYVAIDSSHAPGPPIRKDEVLKTVPTAQFSAEDIIEKFNQSISKSCDLEKVNELMDRKCNCDCRAAAASDPTLSKKLSSNSPR